jgi:hypothetical protein
VIAFSRRTTEGIGHRRAAGAYGKTPGGRTAGDSVFRSERSSFASSEPAKRPVRSLHTILEAQRVDLMFHVKQWAAGLSLPRLGLHGAPQTKKVHLMFHVKQWGKSPCLSSIRGG